MLNLLSFPKCVACGAQTPARSSQPVLETEAYLPSCVNYLTLRNQCRWQPRTRGAIDTARWDMQMHQIRYFLALCEERNFTRAAKRCGVSQPSLTNAIIGLEQELGGALFQRKP